MNKKIRILLLLVLSFSIVSANAMELPTKKWSDEYTVSYGEDLTGYYSDYIYEQSNSGGLSENIYKYNGNIIVVDSCIGKREREVQGGSFNVRMITSYDKNKKIIWESTRIINSFQFYKNYLFVYSKDLGVSCIDLETGEERYTVTTGIGYRAYYPIKLLVNDDNIFLTYIEDKKIYVTKFEYDENGPGEEKEYSLIEEYPEDLKESYDENKRMYLDNNLLVIADKYIITTINLDTDETNTIVRADSFPLNSIKKYKDGYLLCGTKDGHPVIQYTTDEVKWTLVKEGNGKYNSFDFNDNEIIAVGGIYNNPEYNNTDKMIPLLTSITPNGEENYSFVEKSVSSFYGIQFYGIKQYGDSIVTHGDDIEEAWRYYSGQIFTTLYKNNNPLAITYYNIETNIIGDGLVLVDSPNRNDDVIKFTIKGDLISLNIKTKSGQEIEINDDNSFIMPDEDVIITAKFKNQTNPKTSRNIIIAISALLLITIITALTLLFRKKKLNSK